MQQGQKGGEMCTIGHFVRRGELIGTGGLWLPGPISEDGEGRVVLVA